jgi:hypothetical protein
MYTRENIILFCDLITLICIGLFVLLPVYFPLVIIGIAEHCLVVFYIVAISGVVLGTYWKNNLLTFLAGCLLFALLGETLRGKHWIYSSKPPNLFW